MNEETEEIAPPVFEPEPEPAPALEPDEPEAEPEPDETEELPMRVSE